MMTRALNIGVMRAKSVQQADKLWDPPRRLLEGSFGMEDGGFLHPENVFGGPRGPWTLYYSQYACFALDHPAVLGTI